MRKLCVAVSAAAWMGVVSGWAQTTNIIPGLEITMKGKLIPSGTVVTGESLSGNTNPISFVHLEIINGTTTNLDRWIGQIVGSTTNLFLKQRGHVDFTPSAAPVYDFDLGFLGDGQVGTSSNAIILVSGSEKTKVSKGETNETLTATFQGIWVDGTDAGGGEAVAGVLDSIK